MRRIEIAPGPRAVAIAAMHWLAAKQLLLRAKTPRSERILIGRVVSARVAWSAAERTQPPTGPHRRGVVEPFDLDVRGESEPVRVAGGPVRVVGQIDAVDWLVAGDAEHPRAVLRPGAHVTADVVTDGVLDGARQGPEIDLARGEGDPKERSLPREPGEGLLGCLLPLSGSISIFCVSYGNLGGHAVNPLLAVQRLTMPLGAHHRSA